MLNDVVGNNTLQDKVFNATAFEQGIQAGFVKGTHALMRDHGFVGLRLHALGEVSTVLESPIGLHLIYCEEIPPFGMLPFAEVSEHIIERLSDKRRRDAQRSWIKQLFARADARQPA